MIRGLPASILLHVGVLASSYIVLPFLERPADELVIVPIELVNISEVNNIAPIVPVPDAEPEDEPEPDAVPEPEEVPEEVEDIIEEVAPEADIPPPAAAAPEETEPDVPEDVIPDAPEPKEDVPEPEPEEPEPDPKPKQEESEKLDDFLLDDNLFNYERETAKAPPPPSPDPEQEQEPPPEARRGVGDRTAAKARIESIVLSQMKSCWGSLEDLPEPERLSVTVRVLLNVDGTLKEDVELVRPRRAPIGDRFMSVAIDRAMRAVRTCQPYRLPADDYEDWEDLVLNFRYDG